MEHKKRKRSRYQSRKLRRYFRADVPAPDPALYEYLEAEGFAYAVRLPRAAALLREIAPLLTRTAGRPSKMPAVRYAGFLYQAENWHRGRRVVATVEWHNDEPVPRISFIVTNLKWPAKAVVQFYDQWQAGRKIR